MGIRRRLPAFVAERFGRSAADDRLVFTPDASFVPRRCFEPFNIAARFAARFAMRASIGTGVQLKCPH
jgi:hypothetical protein